jgi:hypothetical protein
MVFSSRKYCHRSFFFRAQRDLFRFYCIRRERRLPSRSVVDLLREKGKGRLDSAGVVYG